MIKMYNAEVLSKYPVVQHFPFGSLFSFSPDPNAKKIQATVHTASQPKASSTPSNTAPTARPQPPLRDPLADPSSSATMATRPPGGAVGTAAPWARGATGPGVPSGVNQPTRAPWASRTPAPPPPSTTMAGVGTAAPWAKKDAGGDAQQSTRAPWANKR